MRYKMLGVPLSLFIVSTAQASPISYDWIQTSGSVPGFTGSAHVVIDGEWPVVRCGFAFGAETDCTDPVDFAGLLDLEISIANNFRLTEANFFYPHSPGGLPPDYPAWSISPLSIQWTDSFTSVQLVGTHLAVNTDGDPRIVAGCQFTGRCVAEGFWTTTDLTAVPEPSSLILVGTGVATAVKAMRRRHRAQE
jgi:PEP-CTERM motif-containing protein